MSEQIPTTDPLHLILQGMPDGLVVVSDGTIIYANPAFCLLVDRDAGDLIGKKLSALLAPAYRAACDKNLAVRENGFEMTCRMIIGGKAIPAVLHGNTNSAAAGSDEGAKAPALPSVVVGADSPSEPIIGIITVQGIEAEGIMPLQDRLRDVLEQLPVAVLITDTQGVIEYVNPFFTDLMGYRAEDIMGQTPRMLKSGKIEPKTYAGLWTNLRLGRQWSGELRNRRQDGSLIWQRAMLSPLRDQQGTVTHYLAIYEDISRQKEVEGKVWRQANYDSLTDLPNRILLQDRLAQAVAVAKRHNTSVAVLFIDLDHFKNVNDSYGHSIGDKLLRKAAERILACIRETDTLSRLGGDEFVVLLVHEGNERDDATVADRILKALRAPFSIEGRDIRIGASMGITVYPEDATDPEDLIRNADTAMYQAKTHGRNAFTFFTKELDQTIQAQIQLEGELRQAVAEMNLAVYYQPFVDSRALTIMGAEALIRWPNQNRGFVPPSKFIPIAEELGLIDEIGSWVLFAACSQAKIWQDKLHPRFRIAVNCSGRQILQKGFPDQVREVLTGSGLPGELLELEISESVLMRDSDAMGPNLRALADLGVRLAVDNFGTSHASIKHLRDHPFTILKLDRSCVSDVLHRAEDALLVETAITMARRMGLSVVAEGVESEDQLSFLQEHYCDVIQGYLFGQPLPPDEFMRML